MSTTMAIETNRLCKSFGSLEVIHNCSMHVKQGAIYGFLGANGAGKTTLFKLLTGLLTPDNGSITILGKDISVNRSQILSEIGTLIDSPTFYEHLSARKNLELHAAYMGSAGIGIDKALQMVGLSEPGDRPVSKFSMGMRQRLGIARAFIHLPKLLILDEPINGLDPMGILEMRKLFLTLTQERGLTILLSSHILSEIEHIADQIGVLENGGLVCETSLEQIKAQYQGSLEDYFFSFMSGGKQL